MRDPCQPAFQICITGGAEEEGVWWEIRPDDSPGSKSTGINPKLSKSIKKGKNRDETSVESLF